MCSVHQLCAQFKCTALNNTHETFSTILSCCCVDFHQPLPWPITSLRRRIDNCNECGRIYAKNKKKNKTMDHSNTG